YVLSNGDLPAMLLLDAVARRLPGALAEGSGELESFSAELGGGLEYPHYTRPADFRGWSVPDVLRSGDHARVEAWRRGPGGWGAGRADCFDRTRRELDDEPEGEREETDFGWDSPSGWPTREPTWSQTGYEDPAREWEGPEYRDAPSEPADEAGQYPRHRSRD